MAHSGKILASSVVRYNGEQLYITGANDNTVTAWAVEEEEQSRPTTSYASSPATYIPGSLMMASLAEFVSYKTISSRPEHAEDCRKGATFLGALYKKLGGQVEMLRSDDSRNPVVLATFRGKREPASQRKRILFYGHYDVVPADGKKGNWTHDPFRMVGVDGYLCGRGVSDNKGPVMAALYAATDLMQSKALDNDVVFLIEGEEESGSRGFAATVAANKYLIGHIDYILLANSYWLDDEVPCLTYGLRGVLHATVEVRAPQAADRHSGVDGSFLLDEPLADLTRVLSRLKGKRNRVMLDGFYDCVQPVSADEDKRYDDIVSVLCAGDGPAKILPATCDRPTTPTSLKQSLMARWREPNLTIHRYRVSGPDGSLVPAVANAHVSLRLVPGQEVAAVAQSLTNFLEDAFGELGSSNRFEVRIDNSAEPWLGCPKNGIFTVLEGAVMEVWKDKFGEDDEEDNKQSMQTEHDASGEPPLPQRQKPKKPLYIREGGSIPAVRFLEKEFNAPAAHLPCGQATDAAHLDNERLRVENLVRGRHVFRLVFGRL